MSRNYKIRVIVTSEEPISEKYKDEIDFVFEDRFMPENVKSYLWNDKECWWYIKGICLASGNTEQWGHDRIVSHIRAAVGDKYNIETEWTCLDDLPYNSYETERGK